MDQIELTAEKRTVIGKQVKQLRRDGWVPAVLYGANVKSIPLQVEAGWIRYQHDHVLDDMLQQMGLAVVVEQAPFEPEAGAYQQVAHPHHGHTHTHSHHQHD